MNSLKVELKHSWLSSLRPELIRIKAYSSLVYSIVAVCIADKLTQNAILAMYKYSEDCSNFGKYLVTMSDKISMYLFIHVIFSLMFYLPHNCVY